MQSKKLKATLFALAAALLYSVNMPFSKLLLTEIDPVFMAAFLYLGAGLGIGLIYLLYNKEKPQKNLSKKDLPFTLGMIVLDILAPIFLMLGLQTASSANASLLNNFEIVATTIIALILFKEVVSHRLWIAIFLITLSSILLTVDDFSSLQFSYGSVLVLLACVCWGLENNCTRMIASKNTYEIVMLKGVFSGGGSLIIAFVIGESLPRFQFVLATLLLGFVAFGLSIFLYIRAQNTLGASKTSAYYATSPFIGAFLSFVVFQSAITLTFVISCLIMLLGTIVVVLDTFIVNHAHEHTHNVFVGNQLVKSYTHSHPHHHYHEDQPTTQHNHFQHHHFHHTNHPTH